MTVAIGDLAPDFTLPGTGGRSYSLSEYRGQPVVLVFYPGDNTPVCTRQLNSYTDDIGRFLVAIDDQHPSPRPEDDPHRRPAAL